jgi:hypothetical protein
MDHTDEFEFLKALWDLEKSFQSNDSSQTPSPLPAAANALETDSVIFKCGFSIVLGIFTSLILIQPYYTSLLAESLNSLYQHPLLSSIFGMQELLAAFFLDFKTLGAKLTNDRKLTHNNLATTVLSACGLHPSGDWSIVSIRSR